MEKPYIVDHWRMHGMDISNVWRLECSMKHLNDYNLYGRRITLEEVAERREDVFLSMYNSRFNVKEDKGHKDKTNDPTVEFLPLRNFVDFIDRREPRHSVEHNGRISLMRSLLKSLEDEQIFLDDPTRRGVLEHMEQVIKRDSLWAYFTMVTGKSYKAYVEDLERQVEKIKAQNQTLASALYIEKKGPSGTECRLDVKKPWQIGSMPYNKNFEKYDKEGQPEPTIQGMIMRSIAPPRATEQYLFPVKIALPPVGRQGSLLP